MGLIEAGLRGVLSASMAFGQVAPADAGAGAKKPHDHMRHMNVVNYTGDYDPKKYLDPSASEYSTKYFAWFEGGSQNGMCGDKSDTPLHNLPISSWFNGNAYEGLTNDDGSVILTGDENSAVTTPQTITVDIGNGMFISAVQGNVSRPHADEVCVTYHPIPKP